MAHDGASGVKREAGYGADESDLARGFLRPAITEAPEYDKDNYLYRWTVPSHPFEDQGGDDIMVRDWEFRDRERVSKGFLTRPTIPTQR